MTMPVKPQSHEGERVAREDYVTMRQGLCAAVVLLRSYEAEFPYAKLPGDEEKLLLIENALALLKKERKDTTHAEK